MNRIVFTALQIAPAILFLTVVLANAQTAGPIVRPTPSAKFLKITAEPDAVVEGEKGIRLRASFEVYNLQNTDLYLAAYFENAAGTRLKDKNKNYFSEGGDVAVFRDLKPISNETVYTDETLFLPYSELDLTRAGKYNLRADIDVFAKEGDWSEHLTYHNFTYVKTKTTPLPPSPPEAKLNDVRVEFDVTENNRKGMRIHVNFDVFRLKGKDVDLIAAVQNAAGESLKSESEEFSSDTGNLIVYAALEPGFVETSFEDEVLFLPYDEIKLPPGRHELRLDFDVLYENSAIHLGFYEFWFQSKDKPSNQSAALGAPH